MSDSTALSTLRAVIIAMRQESYEAIRAHLVDCRQVTYEERTGGQSKRREYEQGKFSSYNGCQTETRRNPQPTSFSTNSASRSLVGSSINSAY
jgi:hypothetical protein